MGSIHRIDDTWSITFISPLDNKEKKTEIFHSTSLNEDNPFWKHPAPRVGCL